MSIGSVPAAGTVPVRPSIVDSITRVAPTVVAGTAGPLGPHTGPSRARPTSPSRARPTGLITRPEPIEPVSGPVRAADLRVLGGGPAAAPHGGFDPAAAVSTPAPAPSAVPPPSRSRSAVQRWQSAIAERPLERPRPLPSGFAPLERELVGGTGRVSYTTGPATRHALAAAGAVGASSGSVVHLPAPPTPTPGALLGVLAHELAHARRPVARPRFMLRRPAGDADADERAALDIGRRIGASAGQGISPTPEQVPPVAAGIVGQLPVGGPLGVTRPAAGGAGFGALPDTGLPNAGGSGGGFPGGALPGGGFPGSGYPGGGFPGAAELAGSAAGAGAVIGGVLPGTGGFDSGGGWAAGPTGSTADAAAGPGADGSSADGGPAGAPGAAGPPGSGAGPQGGPGAATIDLDRLAEAVEERLLHQIERRGGRYTGLF